MTDERACYLTCSHLAVSLKDDPGSQVVHGQCLVGLGDAQLPGKPRMLDTSPAGSARTSVMTGDCDVLSLSLIHNNTFIKYKTLHRVKNIIGLYRYRKFRFDFSPPASLEIYGRTMQRMNG